MASSILLIDDDVEYCELLSALLRTVGYEMVVCHGGRTGLEQMGGREFDLVLLDVAMPQIDGFAVLHQLRRISGVPVVMLTSRIASADKVHGLDGGADDYICKPCDPDELLSRIRAILRRTHRSPTARVSFSIGAHRFDTNARELVCEGRSVKLTSLELELLCILLQARGKVVPRETLAMAIQDRPLDVFDRSLDVHISRLRSKLSADGGVIQTVRGIGYVLAGAIEEPARP